MTCLQSRVREGVAGFSEVPQSANSGPSVIPHQLFVPPRFSPLEEDTVLYDRSSKRNDSCWSFFKETLKSNAII